MAIIKNGGKTMPKMRWTMIILCFAATTINYVDRATLGVATPYIRHELGINPATMGLLLSGFFWTYAVMQLPWGWVVDRIGPRITYSFAVLWWSAFTIATGTVNSAASILGFRLALGVGEAASYPSNAKVAALWFPTRERGLAAGIFDSGSRAGSALSLPIIAALVAFYGWRAAFYFTGALGLAWLVVWLLMYRDPAKHTGVTLEALQELRAAQPQRDPNQTGKVSWLSLFRYRTVWGMMIGFFCLNFVFYFYITWFPSFLVDARHFSLKQLGLLGMIPGLAAVPAAWLGGFTSDALHRRGWSLTKARKTCLVGGMLCSSVITLAAFMPTTFGMLLCFTLSYASIAFTGANIWSLPGDVAPTQDHVASLGGIQNFASNLSGIVISTFTGFMLLITKGSFVVPLCVSGGLCVLGAISYLFIVGPIRPLGNDERLFATNPALNPAE
jgi:ACS family D-galactonate transporter-like MFS transporter